MTHPPIEVSVTAIERRSQARNRTEVLERLREALAELSVIPRPRRPTRPTRSPQRRRVEEKRRHG